MGFTIVWPEGAEESLEQEFNSLDAQREACTAYVASQKAEGWVVICKKEDRVPLDRLFAEHTSSTSSMYSTTRDDDTRPSARSVRPSLNDR